MLGYIRQCSDCDSMVKKKFWVNNPICEECIKKYPEYQKTYANKKCDFIDEKNLYEKEYI